MSYKQPFQITAFHSCDKSTGMKVLNGKENLLPSTNAWDWLGSGVYFWEHNPNRALNYANESAVGLQMNKIRIKEPFILGAIIELGNCLNLLEPNSNQIVKSAHSHLLDMYKSTDKPIPTNRGAFRALDCAVIQAVHIVNKRNNLPAYDTIRCAFLEGDLVYEGSNFYDRLHIQVCVINPELIKGYFLPRPVGEFNNL